MTADTVVAFDFDGTLTRHDSVVPFLRRLIGTRRLVVGLSSRAHRLIPSAVRRDRDALKALATHVAFRARSIADVERHASDHAAALLADGLRDDTVARLRWHRDAGHRVVIASASYEPYVAVVGRELGVDAVLATRLEVVDGVCTGRLEGPNCRGAQKVHRLRAWMESQPLDRAGVVVWAYGDSAGDRELLGAADHPVWVTGRLASVAPTA